MLCCLQFDLKELYVGPGINHIIVEENPFSMEVVPHDKKGGVRLSDNITYGCLVEEKVIDTVLWSCPVCEQEIYCSTLSRLMHYSKCTLQEETEKLEEQIAFQKEKMVDQHPLARQWQCTNYPGDHNE